MVQGRSSYMITLLLMKTIDYSALLPYDYDPSKNSDEDPQLRKTYFDDERNEGWIIIDDPDVEVSVTGSMFFGTCLLPGKSFVRHVTFDYLDLRPDTMVGDTYRYQCWGGCNDW